MDGASACRRAAELAEMNHLYRHCFAHCLMLVFKDNQAIFGWLPDVINLIRLITKNGVIYRGLSVFFDFQSLQVIIHIFSLLLHILLYCHLI